MEQYAEPGIPEKSWAFMMNNNGKKRVMSDARSFMGNTFTL